MIVTLQVKMWHKKNQMYELQDVKINPVAPYKKARDPVTWVVSSSTNTHFPSKMTGWGPKLSLFPTLRYNIRENTAYR